MSKRLQLIFLAGIIISFFSCDKEFKNDKKFERPDWLAGKLFTQIKTQPELSTFARCIELSGYDTIIDKSGSYTAFVPDNDAFVLYFQNHPEYKSVEDIPVTELTRMVKYHLVQNPWSLQQLRLLDIAGWIDPSDENNDKPRGFKRTTLLKEKDETFRVTADANSYINIVDTTENHSFTRKYAVDSRKYAPIFYKEYFDIYKLQPEDYEFYFGRSINTQSDIHYLNGRVIKGDIFAENGFIHIIDRVIEPLKNAYQILKTNKDNNSYSEFLSLINNFPSFTYNDKKTLAQPGAREGNTVDSLFDISYPELTFNILNEVTKASSTTSVTANDLTIRFQNGLVAPTNEAFDEFVNEYLVGPKKWGSIKNAPRHIKSMIINACMSNYPIYPSQFITGFKNGEDDLVQLDATTIVQKEYGSNCSFIGVKKAIVPRAFKCVTGPVYLNRGYSNAMYAIQASGLLTELKKENRDYSLFVESDENCRLDSSLFVELVSIVIGNSIMKGYSFFAVSPKLHMTDPNVKVNLTSIDLRILILNHVGIGNPKKIARKEFIRNLAGNFLIFNNETGEVSGTVSTQRGYKGFNSVHVIPSQISTNTDNGKTYDISNWFSFGAASMYSSIQGSYPLFFDLLKQAGLVDLAYSKFNFLSDNEYYTVFAPSDSAINAYRTDTLTTEELKQFLKMHFVKGDLIFTDGNKPAQYYETNRIDEKSTAYTTKYTKIYISPGYDIINIPSKTGDEYMTINESTSTNLITGIALKSVTQLAYPTSIATGVIHKINKVLLFNEVNTN